MDERKFIEEDFTENELMLLRMAFKLVEDVVQIQREDRYDVELCNELFNLKEKLGIIMSLNLKKDIIDSCVDPNKIQVDWTKANRYTSKQIYRVLIDSKEFQQKVLDYIGSEEIDKVIRTTSFDGKPECKSAIIYGMCLASMLTNNCEPFCIIENDKSN